jgi:Family of unknown function (DUF5670)
MLWTFVSIVILLWLIGFVAEIGGGVIHLLLVAAGLTFFFQFVNGLQAEQRQGTDSHF